jgi:hypothetical protein
MVKIDSIKIMYPLVGLTVRENHEIQNQLERLLEKTSEDNLRIRYISICKNRDGNVIYHVNVIGRRDIIYFSEDLET